MIVTPGGVDSHIHFICPQQIDEALMSGVTTMLGGGTGPATGTFATTVTPGPWHLANMLQAAEAYPMNLGFLGKGNASLPGTVARTGRSGRDRPQAARGLGHHARRDRQLPHGRRRPPTRRSRSTPTRSTSRVSSRLRSPRSRVARSTRITPRARAAATRRTSSASAARPTCCRRRPTRRVRTRSTRSTSISTC